MATAILEQAKASTLSLVVLPKEIWENVTATLGEVKEMLMAKATTGEKQEWIESTKARKMLGVSPKTWQSYRDRRIIPFSQIGRKIYVRTTDLEKFMEQHYVKSKGQ